MGVQLLGVNELQHMAKKNQHLIGKLIQPRCPAKVTESFQDHPMMDFCFTFSVIAPMK